MVSPEDYTTLWNWVSFAWIYPLIRKVCWVHQCPSEIQNRLELTRTPASAVQGTHSTLYEMDVWDLSPTMQSKPLFAKFIDYQYVFSPLPRARVRSRQIFLLNTHPYTLCARRRTSTTTLMQRLWIANSQDLILDFSLVYVSTALKYAGPYFLKCASFPTLFLLVFAVY